ncbi:MAG: A/G-specific adenine glycosylase [Phycisphaerales bacterium]|nr:A/G-specific adenine glycosylase [Phycisphaerales bacterium]
MEAREGGGAGGPAGGALRLGASSVKVAAAVEAWFAEAARPLPWRTSPRDPYLALVSEAMLQQTQVSRVVGRFAEFLVEFPTIEALAAADESRVLALWSGLGYYRRARSLHAAAKAVCAGEMRETDKGDTDGRTAPAFPRRADELGKLPGVGPYTAGSIASIVFGERSPLVDGNVARVLLRVHGREGHLADKATATWLWERADELVQAATSPALLNEGLMELGAMVCSPASPKCASCPLAKACRARAEGRQREIPAPRPRAKQRDLYCGVVLAHDPRRGVLVEQRVGEPGGKGVAGRMWAGMWQAPTLERADRAPTRDEVGIWINLDIEPDAERFEHGTTHRRVFFEVWRARVGAGGIKPARGRWMSRAKVAELALSNPQRRILCEL